MEFETYERVVLEIDLPQRAWTIAQKCRKWTLQVIVAEIELAQRCELAQRRWNRSIELHQFEQEEEEESASSVEWSRAQSTIEMQSRERENLIAAQIKYEEAFDGRKETPI